MKYYCNPVNINYRYQFNADQRKNGIAVCREAADPSMITFKGRYYIFASMTLGVWVSDDLVKWENHKLPSELPLYDYAPDVRVMGEYVYFCASKKGEKCDRYRTKDILNGPYEKIEGTFDFWDPNLFVDDDGKAYHIYSSEDNLTLQIAELSDDYLSHTGKYIRIFPGGHNEAPAIFKKDGIYWMITSGCTGWEPNKARLLTATSILGEWKQLPIPCVGENADKTFGGQSTYVLPLQGTEKQFIFMADSWRPESLADSRYIWLPIHPFYKRYSFLIKPDR
jgi:beta-xylosidase